MKEKIGQVFSVGADNAPITGCTISKEISQSEDGYIAYFSLAKNTDISAELFPYHKLLIVAAGAMEVYTGDGTVWRLQEGQAVITPINIPVGMRSKEYAVYTEITFRRSKTMNEAIKAGEVFKLGELVPYQESKIVNMDVLNTPKMKLVVMSFEAGTGLAEHAVPGEALIFALDGEGVIGYEGTPHTIKAGENFHFAKGGAHYVKAEKRFKMALLLTLE